MLDHETCYRAVSSRDPRFDGWFVTAVTTTGIYCRPSCPAMTPQRPNVTFHPTAAAAQLAGFRACRRCRPDASPGSPEWNVRSDTVARAMRLIADGAVDRDGVGGLASRLGYSDRQLHRLLTAEVGAGAQSLARAQRAHTARVLIETTEMAFAEVAFAAGFASIRQFNDTVREVYALSPTELRGRRGGPRTPPGNLRMRLAVRTPFAGGRLLDFLAHHVVAGVEVAGPGWYARTLDLPHGPGTVRVGLHDVTAGGTAFVVADFALEDLRDTSAAVERVRRLLDADCDPVAVDDHLADDAIIGALVRGTPGLRVPGQVDGNETAARTVVGQQVSVAGARTVTAGIVAEHGRRISTGIPGLTHLFPDAVTLAGVDPEALPMPRARGRALVGLAEALASGDIALDRGPDRDDVCRDLRQLPGIGPWTADYIAMRALGHPDVFLPTDLAVRSVLATLSTDRESGPVDVEGWRPWRSYALMHLWNTLMPRTAAMEEN